MAKNNRSHRSELGPDSAGQSGDLQEISNKAGADSESVQELIEEGNAFEAAAISGVENANSEDADVSEVHTHQVPEDDVPAEYLDDDGHI
jgi:N utilization substance protein A